MSKDEQINMNLYFLKLWFDGRLALSYGEKGTLCDIKDSKDPISCIPPTSKIPEQLLNEILKLRGLE